MLNHIATMLRYEFKYMLSKEQCDYIKQSLVGHMSIDSYGKTTIVSLYYDTPDLYLIRTSVEKPKFKEKIRTRAYGLVTNGDKIFLEVKRKVNGIVYKRRVKTSEQEAADFFAFKSNLSEGSQIAREICYTRDFYKNLQPAIMILYDRYAYLQDNSDLRVTIDENPRYRTEDLNLHTSTEGTSLLPPGGAILEIKVQGAMPLWLTKILAEGKIYKTSFSKVGEAYKKCYATITSIERKSAL